jgi:hypothetical protein
MGMLRAHEKLEGPNVLLDRTGTTSSEYPEMHTERFGDQTTLNTVQIPDEDGNVPRIPLFDIRPSLSAGISRTNAIDSVCGQFHQMTQELLDEPLNGVIITEMVETVIRAQFEDKDAWPIEDLLSAIEEITQNQNYPDTEDEIRKRQFEQFAERDREQQEYIENGAMHRILEFKRHPMLWEMLNHVPDWDRDSEQYRDSNNTVLDIHQMSTQDRTTIIDTSNMRHSADMAVIKLIAYKLWDIAGLTVEKEQRNNDNYMINVSVPEVPEIVHYDGKSKVEGTERPIAFDVTTRSASGETGQNNGYEVPKETTREYGTVITETVPGDRATQNHLCDGDVERDTLREKINRLPRGKAIVSLNHRNKPRTLGVLKP